MISSHFELQKHVGSSIDNEGHLMKWKKMSEFRQKELANEHHVLNFLENSTGMF